MSLKVELKPGERIVVGTAILRNGDQRARLFIEGDAPILREKDILTPATADTPARNIYLALQLMYLNGDVSRQHQAYFKLVGDFLAAAPSALELVADINNHILNDELYKALRAAKRLIAYEADLVTHAPGRERLRPGGPSDPVPAAAGGDGPDAGRDPAPGGRR